MARDFESVAARSAETLRTTSKRPRVRASDESGQILLLSGLAMVLMLVCTALVVDVGHAMLVQRQLQAGVDAAALAGVQHLPEKMDAENAALQYSASPGSKNAVNTVDNAVTTAQALCISGVPGCNRRDGGVNGVKVRSTSSVPTWFGRVIGISQLKVSAEATACAPCSVKPLDIMIVLDRTGSMCFTPTRPVTDQFPVCNKLDEAKRGARKFLEFMDPSLDRVGFAVFPPTLNNQWVSSCPTPNGWGSNGYRPWSGGSTSSSTWSNRNVPNGAPGYNFDGRNYGYGGWYPTWDLTESRGQDPNRYVLAGLDESAGNTAQPYLVQVGAVWQLNPASALVQRINCASAAGTTSYHLALESAQYELNNSGHGRPNAQDPRSAPNVIVFLSDGAANTMPTNIPSGHWSNNYISPQRPCRAGVEAANQVKAAGTIIYTIGYGLDANGGGPEQCPNADGISSDSALATMASSPLHYYRVGAAADLERVFQDIAFDIAGSRGRLIDDRDPVIP